MGQRSASQSCVATRNQGVSWSRQPWPRGLPLNPLECAFNDDSALTVGAAHGDEHHHDLLHKRTPVWHIWLPKCKSTTLPNPTAGLTDNAFSARFALYVHVVHKEEWHDTSTWYSHC